MESVKTRGCWSLSLLPLALLTGCGSGDPQVKLADTVPFSGKVLLDGQPLDGATLTFMPNPPGGKGSESATGTTDASGEYKLQIGSANPKSGAVPGKYKVRISRMTTPDGKPYDPKQKGAIPGRESLKLEYSDPQKTTLEAVVPAGGGATKDFDLKSK